MDVNKSGENKDMGSPFRRPTAEETQILQGLTDNLADRFLKLVTKHRGLKEAALATISTARVYLPEEAKALGLIDRIGYLDEAVTETIKISGLPEKARVVTYRRTEFPNDNLYNPLTTYLNTHARPLIDLGTENTASLTPGFVLCLGAGPGIVAISKKPGAAYPVADDCLQLQNKEVNNERPGDEKKYCPAGSRQLQDRRSRPASISTLSRLETGKPADLILITHDHFDHCSP